MFKRNDSAYPCGGYDPGLTKFEQCAKDFTAKWIGTLETEHYPLVDDINKEAVRLGILAADEFCRQMEEREK